MQRMNKPERTKEWVGLCGGNIGGVEGGQGGGTMVGRKDEKKKTFKLKFLRKAKESKSTQGQWKNGSLAPSSGN